MVIELENVDKNGKIGIFDSGIGGVTVFKEILKVLPNEKYIYYSDSINNPYGNKTDDQIYEFSCSIIDVFIEKGCKAVVIACNTASAKVANRLRDKYIDIVILAIEPAYKMVHDFAYDKATLVMATEGTIKSEKFNKLYNKYNNQKTYLLSCSGLADLIEKDKLDEIDDYLQKTIRKYKGNVENVVLGCTHYPLIKDKISSVIGNVSFFDGAYNLALHLKDILTIKKLLNENDFNDEIDKIDEIEFIDSSDSLKKEERFYKILKE